MNEIVHIEKVLEGDNSAFSYFVESYQDMALTIAFRICKNKQDAEDIVQNSFVKAFHNLNTFRQDSKFSTWFYRIVYNTAISSIQSNVLQAQYLDYNVLEESKHNSDWSILAQIDEKERGEILMSALDKLSEGESLILTLFYLEEYSIKEIEEITGLTQANIKVRLHRARYSLKLLLGQHQLKNKELWIN